MYYGCQLLINIVHFCKVCYKSYMITVPQATEKIIKRSRYLSEAMSKDLINASSLARYIQPEVEMMVLKTVTRGSIVMAIKRFNRTLSPKIQSTLLFTDAPDMIVRSNLTVFYLKNSPTLLSKLSSLEAASTSVQKKALFSYGRVETVILANKITAGELNELLKDEVISLEYSDVSSITIHLPESAVTTSGIFNFFIKSIAWEGINLLGMLTTQTEITLIFENKDIHPAFGVLRSLFDLDYG
jgi:hypothetical protein